MLGRAGKTGFAQESDRHPVSRGSVVSGSAIGYITPKDMLAGRQQEIHAERGRKLEAARELRQIRSTSETVEMRERCLSKPLK